MEQSNLGKGVWGEEFWGMPPGEMIEDISETPHNQRAPRSARVCFSSLSQPFPTISTRGSLMRIQPHFRFPPALRGALVLALLGLFTPLAAERADAAKPRNVLFLICDDLNCDLGSYGHPLVKSPNIDALARRGVRFERTYCQYPLCGPSRASFMTGMYPDQTLVHRNAIYIRERVPNVKTMSEMFREEGYFATRVGKIYHYNVPKHIGTSGHDDPYSWDYTINPRGRDKDDEASIFSLRPGNFGGTLSWLAAGGTDDEQTDGIAATEAGALLRKYAADNTAFFLAVGLYRPHTPYVAPNSYFDMYPAEKIKVPAVPEGYLESLPLPARQSVTRKKEQVNLDPRLAVQAIQAYYASITFADAQIGRILEVLEETGLAENTLVVFTSDHGYHMGEHGHYQKTTLFENATRVPLIVAGPNVSARGTTCATPVEMVDFYPTLAESFGFRRPAHVSGISLVPALEGRAGGLARKSALSQYQNGYSVRTERYRYTQWKVGAAGTAAELYDHQQDPEELVNRAGQANLAEVEQQLARLLAERVAGATAKPRGVQQILRD